MQRSDIVMIILVSLTSVVLSILVMMLCAWCYRCCRRQKMVVEEEEETLSRSVRSMELGSESSDVRQLNKRSWEEKGSYGEKKSTPILTRKTIR